MNQRILELITELTGLAAQNGLHMALFANLSDGCKKGTVCALVGDVASIAASISKSMQEQPTTVGIAVEAAVRAYRNPAFN